MSISKVKNADATSVSAWPRALTRFPNMRRTRDTNDVPSDPRLRLAHRVKAQSATPSVPPLGPAAASTSSAAATPLHGPGVGSASPLLDSLGIKRSSSVVSWADQRTLLRHEVRFSLRQLPGVGRGIQSRVTLCGDRVQYPASISIRWVICFETFGHRRATLTRN